MRRKTRRCIPQPQPSRGPPGSSRRAEVCEVFVFGSSRAVPRATGRRGAGRGGAGRGTKRRMMYKASVRTPRGAASRSPTPSTFTTSSVLRYAQQGAAPYREAPG